MSEEDLAAAVKQNEAFEEDWEHFKEQFSKAEQVLQEFVKVKTELDAFEEAYRQFVEYTVATINEAKEAMKEVLSSPFLLPGLWAARLSCTIRSIITQSVLPAPWKCVKAINARCILIGLHGNCDASVQSS